MKNSIKTMALISLLAIAPNASAGSIEITAVEDPRMMRATIKTDKRKCQSYMGPLGCVVVLEPENPIRSDGTVLMSANYEQPIMVDTVKLQFRGWDRGYSLTIADTEFEKLGLYGLARRYRAEEILKQAAEKIPTSYAIHYWLVPKQAAISK